MNVSADFDNVTDVEDLGNSMVKVDYPLTILYVIVFVWALVSNILVIIIVWKYEYMRNVTNYFLVNLSVADLLVTLVCMPNAVYRAYTFLYSFGKLWCKISAYLECISVASSIFTITAMAIDRYLAITRPFGFFHRSFNKTTTIVVIVLIWFSSMALFYPFIDMVVYESIEIPNITYVTYTICVEAENSPHKQTMGIIWFVFMFVIPGLIMTFAYSMMGRTLCSVTPLFDNNESMSSTQQRNRVIRGRKRVAIILLLLAFVFTLCWLPIHIINLLEDIGELKRNSLSTKTAKKYLLLLGHANSALNPVIYCALSRKFRDSIKDLCLVKINFRRRRPLMHVDSSGSATQLHYLTRLKSVPTVNNQFHFGITRMQSSQKTTKTCAV
ncbi:orexin receptor type 2-like [Aethina tumida]|uniref:orexin receptor type 2-like n=1 Tax=Aethina tumida TaxID=116153 RepID=UPI002148BFCC|nr:orexin receptor type 2-like [Aethina tumida]